MLPHNIQLTPTEHEILVMVASGMSNREIAEKRYCSLNTVRTHLQTMLAHNHLHSRAALVALAYESGTILPRWFRPIRSSLLFVLGTLQVHLDGNDEALQLIEDTKEALDDV